jgi:Sulfotransferase family
MIQSQIETEINKSKFQQLLAQTSPQTQEFYQYLIQEDCSLSKISKLILLVKSTYYAWQNKKYRHDFDKVNSYCTFIGCGRTGHSLIGSLIDAHPDMVMSDELNVMTLIEKGFNKKQIYSLIIEESKIQAKNGREVTGYSYQVPNQWQGKLRKLQVIGDKFSTTTTAMLQKKPYLLTLLSSKLGTQIKFIHITRNPYDVIKTFTTREAIELKTAIELYYLACQAIAEVKSKIESHNLLEFKHEAFLENPQQYLTDVCRFLEVETTSSYLDDCSSIVYKSPHKSRYEIDWDSESIDLVKKLIDDFSFLQSYSFEE